MSTFKVGHRVMVLSDGASGAPVRANDTGTVTEVDHESYVVNMDSTGRSWWFTGACLARIPNVRDEVVIDSEYPSWNGPAVVVAVASNGSILARPLSGIFQGAHGYFDLSDIVFTDENEPESSDECEDDGEDTPLGALLTLVYDGWDALDDQIVKLIRIRDAMLDLARALEAALDD